MAANISFNPFVSTNAPGTFSVTSDGLVQGALMDDPSSGNYLTIGALASTETLPMWGGVGIFEDIPAVGAGAVGPSVGRATTLANLTGFSVANQAYAWITTPQSGAPSAGSGMTIPFVRFGSNSRLAVQIDPALVSLNGGLTTQQVSWDFNAQRLIPYYPTTGAITVSALTPSASAGVVSVAGTSASAHNLSVGSDFTISGAVPNAYNGDWTATAIGSTTTFTFVLLGAVTTFGTLYGPNGPLAITAMVATVSGGVVTVSLTTASAHGLSGSSSFTISNAVPAGYNGGWVAASAPTTTTLTFTYAAAVTATGQLNAGGGALNVRVLETQVGNSKTIVYSPTTGYVNYNPTGACAIILI